MNTASLQNLWNYINGLSLSANNKRWLSDRLIESTSEQITKEESLSSVPFDESVITPRVKRLIGCVKLDRETIKNDDRLSYLLNK